MGHNWRALVPQQRCCMIQLRPDAVKQIIFFKVPIKKDPVRVGHPFPSETLTQSPDSQHAPSRHPHVCFPKQLTNPPIVSAHLADC